MAGAKYGILGVLHWLGHMEVSTIHKVKMRTTNFMSCCALGWRLAKYQGVRELELEGPLIRHLSIMLPRVTGLERVVVRGPKECLEEVAAEIQEATRRVGSVMGEGWHGRSVVVELRPRLDKGQEAQYFLRM